jgi:sugar/nucleoside kinase (ribokinase family)
MKRYQVVGIGNAIVDVFTQANDTFLEMMGIEKGIMQLVERERGEMLYGAMENRRQAAGGSVANTLAGLGSLGLTTGFIGRVHDDALGRFYAQTMADGANYASMQTSRQGRQGARRESGRGV